MIKYGYLRFANIEKREILEIDTKLLAINFIAMQYEKIFAQSQIAKWSEVSIAEPAPTV